MAVYTVYTCTAEGHRPTTDLPLVSQANGRPAVLCASVAPSQTPTRYFAGISPGSARQNESLFRSNGTHVFVLLGFRFDGISFQRDRALQRVAY